MEPYADEVREELLGMVRDEHQRTNDFIARLISLRTAIAALTGSLWSALVALGISSEHAAAFVAAVVVTSVLGVLDLSYAAHYRALRSQLRRVERVLNANFKLLARPAGQAASASSLKRTLLQIEIGTVALLERPSPKRLAKSWDLRTVLYLVMVVMAALLGAWVVIG